MTNRRQRRRSSFARAEGSTRAVLRWTMTGWLGWLGASSPSIAFAQPDASAPTEPTERSSLNDTTSQRAMEAYRRGATNYNLAQYEAALADFKEAASLYASPQFQFNIGLCYEKLGKYEEAVRAFATYLKAMPDAEDRAEVEARIDGLQTALEQQRREEQVAAEPPAPSPAPVPASPVASDPSDTNVARSNGRSMIVAGSVLIGAAAAAAIGGGIGFGMVARNASDQIDALQSGQNSSDVTVDQAQAIDVRGRRQESIQVGMVAAGSAVAVAGALVLAFGLRQRHAFTASAWVDPAKSSGLALTGRF